MFKEDVEYLNLLAAGDRNCGVVEDLERPFYRSSMSMSAEYKAFQDGCLRLLSEKERDVAEYILSHLYSKIHKLFFLKTLHTYPEYVYMVATFSSGALADATKLKMPAEDIHGYIQYKKDVALIKIAEYRMDAVQLLDAKLGFFRGGHKLAMTDIYQKYHTDAVLELKHTLKFKYLYPALEWSN